MARRLRVTNWGQGPRNLYLARGENCIDARDGDKLKRTQHNARKSWSHL